MDNISNTTNVNQGDLKYQAPSLPAWLVLGATAVLTNFLVILTIIKSKSLQTKCMYTLASLAASDCLFGFSGIITGAVKIEVYLTAGPEYSYQITSFLCGAWYPAFATVSDTVTLALNIDRWLAMAYPVKYSQLKGSYVIGMNAAAWTVSLLFWASALYMKNPYSMVTICSGTGTPDMWFQNLYAQVRWVVVGLNLLLFLMTIISLRRRMTRMKFMATNQERKKAKKEMEIGMIKTMGVLLVFYIFFKTAAYVLTTYAANQPKALKLTIHGVAPILAQLYAITHFPVYMIMSRRFKAAFLGDVLGRHVSVAPAKSANHTAPLFVVTHASSEKRRLM